MGNQSQLDAIDEQIALAFSNAQEKANLEIPLTTYVSRHSWATIAKRKNVALSVISDALGQDSETTTQIYLSSIEPATIDRANSLIISGL